MEKNSTYKLARLVKGVKRSYILFYAWSEPLQKSVRKRIYVDNMSEADIKDAIKQVDTLLKSGKTIKQNTRSKVKQEAPAQKKKPEKNSKITLQQGINIYFSNRITGNSRKSVIGSMKSYRKIILDYFTDKKLAGAYLNEIKANHILTFLDKLIKSGKSPRTRNNYLHVMNTMFIWLKKRKYCKKNPCKGIDDLTVQEKAHFPYTPEQTKELSEWMKKNDYQLYLCCMFLYYGFLRPNELNQLQIKHVAADKIMTPGSLSKNEKTQYVTIPDKLNKIIDSMGIRGDNPDWYVFSSNGKQGPTKLPFKSMSRRYKFVKDAFRLGTEYTMYGWKHTGVVNLFNNGFDIKFIQQHCRHSDIRMTDIYLRSLGLFRNDKIKTDYPEV